MMKDLRKHKVNALDVSADEQLVCTGTNNSLNILLFDDGSFQTKATFQLSHNLTDPSTGRIINVKPIVDLKFNPYLSLSHLVATSSSSGVIAVWNLNQSRNQEHISLQTALTEHKQTVNSISWHPSNPQTLLSGSQDRCVKVWDLRVKQGSTLTLHPRSGFVRDVQHRKSDGERFAAAFDNGTVQVWDVRFPKSCEVRFTAHDMALSVDWHPEACDLLASGGRDGYIKVWNYDNVENADRADSNSTSVLHRYHDSGDPGAKVSRTLTPTENNTAAYTVQTVGSSVTRVRWRPNHYYHIASSSSRGGSISLWNVAEPNVPLALLGKYPDPVVSFAWKDQFLSKKEVCKSSLYECWWRTEEEEIETVRRKYEEFNTSTVNSSFSGVSADGGKEFGVAARKVERYDVYHNRIHKYQDHTYNSVEESEISWGIMVSSSKISGVQSLTLDEAVKPLSYLHPSCISISPKGHLAMVHDHIDSDHAENALRVVSRTRTVSSLPDTPYDNRGEVADGGQDIAQGEEKEHSKQFQKHLVRIYRNPDKGSVLFDAQRFSTLAENYHTPQTMRMERDKRYADMKESFANLSQTDRAKSAGTWDTHAVSSSCDHNAKEAASAPELAQLWRIVKLYLQCEEIGRGVASSVGVNVLKQQSAPGVGLSSFHSSAGELKHLWGEDEDQPEANDLTASKKSSSIQTKSSASSADGEVDGEDDDGPLLFSQSPVESKTSLWQRGSINMLMKLNKILPMKGEDFLLNSDTMIQDSFELKAAFMRSNRSQRHKKEDQNESSNRRRQLHTYENPLRKESRYLRDLALRHNREAQLDEDPTKLTRKSRLKRSSSEGFLGSVAASAEEDPSQQATWGEGGRNPQASEHHGNTTSSTHGMHSYLKMVHPRLIDEILDHHAEKGDVQTCVMIALVLEKHITVDAVRMRQWLCSYIDVLQRLQLFSVSARIISTCNNEYVRARYQRSNVVAMQCTTPGCTGKQVKKGFTGQCQTCAKTISECSICQLPVRDVFVWCQVCGHGGHLAHLEHWFKTENLCPTGCGHACNLFSRATG